jgi:hypothetical protein
MKDKILDVIFREGCVQRDVVEKIYKITNSYDATVECIELSFRYNRNCLDIAEFLYGKRKKK